MPEKTTAPSYKGAMRGAVMAMNGADRRECLIWDATPSGCRISGNVDGLPDLISIEVRGVDQPMKGRVASRAPGSVGVTFAWEDPVVPEPTADETSDAPLELDTVHEQAAPPAADPAASSDLSDEQIVEIYKQLEKSILERLK